MTHFNDYAVVEHDLVVLRYLSYTTNGLYTWEYFSTLDFELDVIRRRRPYLWTIWIYSLTRMTTLMAVILNFVFVSFDGTTPINCQVWNTLELTLGYLSIVSASLLIIFRIIAIWNKNKLVVGTAIIVCATNVIVIILGIVQTRSAWDFVLKACIVLNTEKTKPSIIVTLLTQIGLLLIMLIGLLRLLHDGVGAFALGSLLWKQGVIWLLIATVAGVPPVVFIVLNLNVPLNLMFQLPSVIAMSIAATRIYRKLADYVYRPTDILLVSLQMRNEQSITNVDGQLGDNSHGSNLDSDLERAMENPVPR